MELAAALVAAALIALFIRYTTRKSPKGNLPPLVPGCIPLIGNVIGFNRKCPHFTLTDWARKYGDIFRFKVLGETIVVLNSSDYVRDALIYKADDFAGRPFLFRVHYGFHYAKDIIFGSISTKWLLMKRYAAQFLRAYTSGLADIDGLVEEELNILVRLFNEKNAVDFDPSLILMTAVVNGITASLLGKRYNHDHPLMVEYKSTTRLFSESCSSVQGMELDLFPWLRFLPNTTFVKLNQARDQIDHFVDTELAEINSKLDHQNPKCMLDAFLIKAMEDEKNAVQLPITSADVRCIFVDILVSGTLTSSIAMSSFVLIMAQHQDLQRDLQSQVDRTLGKRKIPTPSDRKSMPLIEAAMLETLRFISHIPLNLPHFTMCDTQVGGYDIPKDTMVMLNLWAVHHDPRIWDEPWKFNPNRFLDASGNPVSNDHVLRKSLLPFGAGRRMCLGESLARERLFLFATVLLRNFTFLPSISTPSTCDPCDFDLGLILEPKPFQIRAEPRKVSESYEQ
ncbi:hypothetical protein CAPTEDRAFT_152410 [Capitella teleta]|uniref:Uncharacterized protein n=1 Tax=Capitella teleta TaxID=283909 RepID=R7V2W6_CAPTE|nr:hypothetical protein CAPTEDRAFT_152410 [Capitella teleta]|eukprot:ELU10041.1 hypothetical protein CAPTEDRAFT_152410 [Capitella teleta]